jgi:hypothetical protein
MVKSLRFGMPFLSAGQAQKEVTHNEAILLLDALVSGCCPGAPSNAPPQDPEIGLSYICGAAPIGAWAGHAKGVACWSQSGWRFVEAFDGLQLVDRSNGYTWRYMAGHWSSGVVDAGEIQVNGVKVLGLQQAGIANASGGLTIDTEARHVLTKVLGALRSHGLIASAG